MQSSLDGITLAYGLLPLLKELSGEHQKTLLYNDNQGACTVMNIPQGTWRTRHLRLKAAWFFEQLEHAKFRIYHVPGKYMLGDLCTKSLQGVRVRELLSMMNIHPEPSGADGGESSGQKIAKAALRTGLEEVLETSESKGERARTSGSEGERARTSGSEGERARTSGSEGERARTSGSEGERARTSGSEGERARTSGSEGERARTSGSEGERARTSGSGGESTRSTGSGGAALKLLSVAASLKTVASKWVRIEVQVGQEGENPEASSPRLGSTLLTLSVILAAVGALALIAWLRCMQQGAGPRIQSVRADSERTDSEWSVLSEQEGEPSEGVNRRDDGPDDEGSSRANRVYCSRSLAVPASDDPRGSLTQRDDDPDDEGSRRGNRVYGSRSLAVSASNDPRGSLTRRDCDDRVEGVGGSSGSGLVAPELPSGSTDGLRRRKPRGSGSADLDQGSAVPVFPGFGGLQAAAQSAGSSATTTELREGNELRGVLCGNPSGTPSVLEPEPQDADDTSDDEESRGESDLRDEELDTNTLAQDTVISRATERYKLEIFPNWPLRAPPMFAWGEKPQWGGWEAKFHQSIPLSCTSDFWYHDTRRNVLVRFHAKRRRKMFVPSPSGLPRTVLWAALTGRRRTFSALQTNNTKQIIEDSWIEVDPKPGRFLSESWRGRTEFELSIE